MKLFKSDQKQGGLSSLKSAQESGFFQSMNHHNNPNQGGKHPISATSPNSINDIREKSALHESGNYLLFSLLRELAGLGDKDEFQMILKHWGSTLAQEIIDGCRLIQSEEDFDLLVEYLNELLLLKRMGCFQCNVSEHDKTVTVDYFFTKFDQNMFSRFGESYSIGFYGTFFERLMELVIEAKLALKSVEGSDELWRFTFIA